MRGFSETKLFSKILYLCYNSLGGLDGREDAAVDHHRSKYARYITSPERPNSFVFVDVPPTMQYASILPRRLVRGIGLQSRFHHVERIYQTPE